MILQFWLDNLHFYNIEFCGKVRLYFVLDHSQWRLWEQFSELFIRPEIGEKIKITNYLKMWLLHRDPKLNFACKNKDFCHILWLSAICLRNLLNEKAAIAGWIFDRFVKHNGHFWGYTFPILQYRALSSSWKDWNICLINLSISDSNKWEKLKKKISLWALVNRAWPLPFLASTALWTRSLATASYCI